MHTHSAPAGQGFTLHTVPERPVPSAEGWGSTQRHVKQALAPQPSLSWRDSPDAFNALGSQMFARILTSVEGEISGSRLSTAVISWVETSWVKSHLQLQLPDVQRPNWHLPAFHLFTHHIFQ